MRYEKLDPSDRLREFVKEYWIYENEESIPTVQKIIPDGFSEIIVHYGDPYKIKLKDSWQIQAPLLFSNQISKYFFLENTGTTGMLGIKLHPTAFYEIFQTGMEHLTDQVLALDSLVDISGLKSIQQTESIESIVQLAENWLISYLNNVVPQTKIRICLDTIFSSHGMVDVNDLANNVQLSTRQLERQFKKVIGLTPKFYYRIIRFNYIFEVMKEHKDSWVRTALQSGYFDQSHFIKNFKEFTGEEPSAYGFDEVNLANFFLQK